jgi:hypothetical protein
MRRFRTDYPAETTDMDAAVSAAHEYRRLHERLETDDLPRFEAEFKNYLNTNTIRDVAGFQSALNKERQLIRERVDRINESLLAIDYNPGRYIRLETQPTPSVEIRDFRHEFRACTDNSLSGGDAEQYSGQKEKLAYTILAASLAYQFKLDWGIAHLPDVPVRRHRRSVRPGVGRVHPLRAEPVPHVGTAAAHRDPAAEDPRDRTVRRRRRVRGRPHRELVADPDADDRGIPCAGSCRGLLPCSWTGRRWRSIASTGDVSRSRPVHAWSASRLPSRLSTPTSSRTMTRRASGWSRSGSASGPCGQPSNGSVSERMTRGSRTRPSEAEWDGGLTDGPRPADAVRCRSSSRPEPASG